MASETPIETEIERKRASLRERAMQRLGGRQEDGQAFAAVDKDALIEELLIYQAELEVQNEELRHAQVALEIASNRFQELFLHSPVGYFLLDDHGAILESNLIGADLLGQPRARLAGLAFQRFLQRDGVQSFLGLMTQATRGVGIPLELRVRRSERDSFWGHCVASRFPGEERQILLALNDVSDRHERLDQLDRMVQEQTREIRHQRDLLQTIVDGIDDPITLSNLDGRYQLTNRAAARLFGCAREAMVGRHAREIVPEEAAGRLLAIESAARNAGCAVVDELHWADAGEAKTYLAGVYPHRDEEGRLTGIISVWRDVTRLKAAEESLQGKVEELETLLSSIPALVYTKGADLRYRTANAAWSQFLGIDRERVADATDYEILPESQARILRRGDREALTTGRAVSGVEGPWTRRDGETRWMATNRAPLRDGEGRIVGVMGVTWDLTDRKRAEEALRRSEEKYRLLFENARVGVCRVDLPTGRILEANRHLAALLGHDRPEQLEGCFFHDFALEGENARRRTRELRERGVTSDFESPFVDRHDRALWLQCSGWLVPGTELADFVLIDVTALRRAREQAEVQQTRLIQADKMISLGTLVSGMAHEINNPNQFVALNAPMLRDLWNAVTPALDAYAAAHPDFRPGGRDYPRLRERIPRLLEGIHDGAQRIRAIVDDLKAFARQEEETPAERVDVNAVVASALVLTQNAIKKATHRFAVEYAAGLPPVRGSRQRLGQVVINLVINACEALPGPEAAIGVRTAAGPERGTVLIEVRDEGRGMSPEVLRQATDPFFTTKRDSGGTGLGLSISHTIVERMGGRLLFESRPEAGATARIVLPAIAQETP